MHNGLNAFYRCVVGILLLFFPTASVAQSGAVFQRVSQSLVKIETNTTSASGFIWLDSSHAVTSLHVVDGKNSISAHYVNADGNIVASSQAVVERVLKKSDLVLLRLQNPQNREPLSVTPSLPRVKQVLDALGFPLNITGYSNTEVKVRFGGNQLRSILPPKVLRKILDFEYPSTTIEILNLEGNLVPGLSGAPIVDSDGKVAGIVDGGLESGAIGISWGIPSSHLKRLARSNEIQVPKTTGIAELFAADLQADVGQIHSVGNVRLTKLRSRTFQQLAETADDRLGLDQLTSIFAMFNPFSFRYDIYQDMESGATIVVPEGAQLSSQENFTVVSVNTPRMEMKFRITRVQDQFDVQNQSVIFEQQLTELDSTSQVFVDPFWSYLAPMTRFGMTINRKGIFRNIFNGFMWQMDKYYFETLATNGRTLLAVAAVNNDNSPETLQMEEFCIQGFNDPQCIQLLRSQQIWAQMVLGVQFASFPQIQM